MTKDIFELMAEVQDKKDKEQNKVKEQKKAAAKIRQYRKEKRQKINQKRELLVAYLNYKIKLYCDRHLIDKQRKQQIYNECEKSKEVFRKYCKQYDFIDADKETRQIKLNYVFEKRK